MAEWWSAWRWRILFTAAVVLFPLVVEDNYHRHMAVTVGLMVYLAMTWNIVGGLAGHLSFGHAAFVGVGAYTSTLLFAQYGLTPWVGLVAGGGVAMLLGLVVGFPSFRLRGPFFSLATLALGEVVKILVINSETIGPFEVRGAAGIIVPLKGNAPELFQFNGKLPYYWIIWTMIGLAFLVSHLLRRSRHGLFLRAIADDEEAARANGVSVLRTKMIALLLSAFLAAAGGTFYAQFYRTVDPVNILSVGLSIELVLLAVVGGTKYLHGPLWGALLLVPLSEYARSYLGGDFFGLHKIVYGVMLMAVILFLPNGLASLPELLKLRAGRARGKADA